MNRSKVGPMVSKTSQKKDIAGSIPLQLLSIWSS